MYDVTIIEVVPDESVGLVMLPNTSCTYAPAEIAGIVLVPLEIVMSLALEFRVQVRLL